MAQIPRDPALDSTLGFLRDPYRYIGTRARALGSDVFEARLLLRKTVCMTGAAAAEVFYDPQRFVRAGAAPMRIRKTLFGQGGVQGLDGDAHRQRKRMLMSLMSPDRVRALRMLTRDELERMARLWSKRGHIVLYDEFRLVLTRVVCAWSGVPLQESELPVRARELTALFQHAGGVGPNHWESRIARSRAERWAAHLVRCVRDGTCLPPENSALHAVAWHRELDSELLDPQIAAVELLNVLRPTVAVAVYCVLLAHALHVHANAPIVEDDAQSEIFVQEVRRYYPFFPAVAARVKRDFDWNGFPFEAGTRAMLDLYGTDHDARTWEDPDVFRPERFRRWDGSPFNFIPQGGGRHETQHRCPGEWITIELMKEALDLLARRLSYVVPTQDLEIPFDTLPALPRSGFVVQDVRLRL